MCRLTKKERLENFSDALQQVYTCYGVSCLIDRYFPIQCMYSSTYKKYALDIFEQQCVELQWKRIGDATRWECHYADKEKQVNFLLWSIERRKGCKQYDEPVCYRDNCIAAIETQNGGFYESKDTRYDACACETA